MKQTSAPVQIRDMTEGNAIRLILLFAIPLFIGNIFQQVYSMVDTMVVGYHLGDSAIAAIGITNTFTVTSALLTLYYSHTYSVFCIP